MSTVEQKYEAARILMALQTDMLIKFIEDDGGDFVDAAIHHRDLFVTATKDRPDIYAAGMEVAREMVIDATDLVHGMSA